MCSKNVHYFMFNLFNMKGKSVLHLERLFFSFFSNEMKVQINKLNYFYI